MERTTTGHEREDGQAASKIQQHMKRVEAKRIFQGTDDDDGHHLKEETRIATDASPGPGPGGPAEWSGDSLWRQLAWEIWIQTFKLLDEGSLRRAASVCRAWRTIESDNAVWEAMYRLRWKVAPTPPPHREPSLWKRSFRGRRKLEHDSLRLPSRLVERQVDALNTCFNKVFVAAWVDDVCVVGGTKDNRLFRVDTLTEELVVYKLPNGTPMTDEVRRAAGGIHCLSYNPNTAALATGGTNPADLVLYSLRRGDGERECRARCVLAGHQDWLFGCDWLTDTVLVSGGRDALVKAWDLSAVMAVTDPADAAAIEGVRCIPQSHGPALPVVQSYYTVKQHLDKVRDLRCNRVTQQAASLGGDGVVKLWQAGAGGLDMIRSIPLGDRKELICMAVDPELNVVAAGSLRNITVMDPRAPSIICDIASVDQFGVRTVKFHHWLIGAGGATGRISFVDVRTWNYLPVSDTDAGRTFVETSRGHWRSFLNDNQLQAVYTMDFNSNGGSLFAGGGPLTVAAAGSYAAVWSALA